MRLTKKEKELILQRRADEEAEKAQKEGFLKFDLYDHTDERFQVNKWEFWYFSLEQKEEIIKDFLGGFSKVLEANTRFVCYIEDGEELWYDDAGGYIEAMDKQWAKKYLTNIRPIK